MTIDRSSRRRLLAGVLLAVLPAALGAQDVSGVLRDERTGTAAEGVVVTAMRLADRAVVARTLTAAAGSFRLGVGLDSVVVLALRIGQQPVELWRGRLAPGERRDISLVLPARPIEIATLRVRERDRCGAPTAGESSVTRTLFADALTALAALLGSADGEAPVMRTALTEQYLDLRGNVQRTVPAVERTGPSAQPFRSVPVSELLRDGFVLTERDGSSTYRAPDAHVLSSPAFLERTCLSLDLTRETEGLVGVRFTPQRAQRDRVDVRGVLWLDIATRALRRLEFGYVGLPQVAAVTNPGGVVEYAQLADGRWIVDRWSLRMPTLVTEYVAAPYGGLRTPRTRAAGVQLVGGVVLEARLRGALLYTVGGPEAERALTGIGGAASGGEATVRAADALAQANASAARAAAEALAGAVDATACSVSDPSVAEVIGVVRRADGEPVAGALVDAEWRGRWRHVLGPTWDWEVLRAQATTGVDGRFRLCGVPRDKSVAVVARTNDTRSRSAQLRLPAEGAAGVLELVLQSTRFGMISVHGR